MGEDSAPSEYQIKSAIIYNFAKFITWPPDAYAQPDSPIVIGVMGKNVFGANLEQAIHDKVVNGRPLEFREIHALAEATNCHILFISPSEKAHLPDILGAVRHKSVLTVSEMDQFLEAGGMINLVIENNRIRFEINDDVARQAGLVISSKLLTLAVHKH